MPDTTELMFHAFEDEMRKCAAVPWQALGGNVGAMLGTGAALGAGLGAIRGGLHAYNESRDYGNGAVDSAMRGLQGGLGGALSGGALGAAAGGLAGAAGTYLAPKATSAFARHLASGQLGSTARFGQRQVHGLTGWTPEEGLSSIGAGAESARRGVQAAGRDLEQAMDSGKGVDKAMSNLHRATAGRSAAEEVERRGMTSIPGALRALRQDAPGALMAAAKNQWHNSNKLEKAFLVGDPALRLARDATTDDPEHHRGEMVGRDVAGIASGMALGGVPLVGQLAGGMAAGGLGGLVGKGIDKLRSPGLVHRKPDLEPADNTSHVPTERVMSNSAMGQAPEVLG